jgi:hypothetical protein
MPVKEILVQPAKIEDYTEIMQSVFNNSIVHGPVIGAVLQLNLNMVQETTIFFTDGFVEVSDLPMIGIDLDEKPEYKYNVLALKDILMQIPALGKHIEGDYLCKRGNLEEIKQYQDKEKICYFVFRSPEEARIDYSGCLGTWIMDTYSREIGLDSDCEFMPEVGAI